MATTACVPTTRNHLQTIHVHRAPTPALQDSSRAPINSAFHRRIAVMAKTTAVTDPMRVAAQATSPNVHRTCFRVSQIRSAFPNTLCATTRKTATMAPMSCRAKRPNAKITSSHAITSDVFRRSGSATRRTIVVTVPMSVTAAHRMQRRQHVKMKSFDVDQQAHAFRFSGGAILTMIVPMLLMRRTATGIRLVILGCSLAVMASASTKHGRVVSACN